jgi:hypothetical protein
MDYVQIITETHQKRYGNRKTLVSNRVKKRESESEAYHWIIGLANNDCIFVFVFKNRSRIELDRRGQALVAAISSEEMERKPF